MCLQLQSHVQMGLGKKPAYSSVAKLGDIVGKLRYGRGVFGLPFELKALEVGFGVFRLPWCVWAAV